MSKPKPVYQYDMYGNFVREFSSITEASKAVEGRSGRIRKVAMGEKNYCQGFQWRYKHEIEDKSEKIGLGTYRVDDEVERLFQVWYGAKWNCHSPKGDYYDTDLEMWEPWRKSFDKFYYDMIDEFREAHRENPEYKNDIECHHIWLSRIDKTKSWTPDNLKFMTPDFSHWHRETTIKVVRDGRTLTVPQIAEELASRGIEITPASLHQRLKKNQGLMKPNKDKRHKFNGRYYSLGELAEILDFDYDYVRRLMNRENMELMEAVEAYQENTKYSFRGHDGLTYSEYIDELEKHCNLKRHVIRARVNEGFSADEILDYETGELVGRGNRKKVAHYIGGRLIEVFDYIREASRNTDISEYDISDSVLYNIDVDGHVFKEVDTKESAKEKVDTKKLQERKILLVKWKSILKQTNYKSGRYYDTDIRISGRWEESFDNFFEDNISRYLEAQKRLETDDIWLGRKDKEGDWTFDNTHFTTPREAVKIRSNSITVEVDGEILTPREVSEKLKEEKGVEVRPVTIRQRIRNGKNVMDPNSDKKYKYEGEYYSLPELSEMLDFGYDHVKARINRYNESLEEAIQSYRDYYGYSFKGEDNLTRSEWVDRIVDESGLARTTVNYRLRNGYSVEEVINVEPGARKGTNKIKIGKFKDGDKLEEFDSMKEASGEVDYAYTTFHQKVKRGEEMEGFLFKKINSSD